MTRGRARTHLLAPGPDVRRAFCGWIEVDCESDVSRVTCKACLARLAADRKATKSERAAPVGATRSEVVGAVVEALAATLAPRAAASPRVTPQLWSASCKGGEHRRCGECEVCLWEREAQLWAAVSPWNREPEVRRPEGAPRWSSLAAALVAFAEFERHDRTAPSALGGILDRVRRGDTGGSDGGRRGDDPLLRRAGELVRIKLALEHAYPDGAHAKLTAAQCKDILLWRTPGVLHTGLPTYEMLSAAFHVDAGELQALVREGRRRMTAELAARGLIPYPKPAGRPFGSATMREVQS